MADELIEHNVELVGDDGTRQKIRIQQRGGYASLSLVNAKNETTSEVILDTWGGKTHCRVWPKAEQLENDPEQSFEMEAG